MTSMATESGRAELARRPFSPIFPSMDLTAHIARLHSRNAPASAGERALSVLLLLLPCRGS
jgi:hypothetical protein